MTIRPGATLLLLTLLPMPAFAQETGWAVEAEAGAALFFGNTSQTTVTTRFGAETADSTRELSIGFQFNYGEAEDDTGDTFVSKRSWKLSSAFDYRPFHEFSPFVFGELERAFERRIDARYSAGAGAKLSLQRSDRGRVDVSVALLAEKTEPTEGMVSSEFEDELLARWSGRFRARRTFGEERITVDHLTSYRPRFNGRGDYTVSSTTSLAFVLNTFLSLKVSFVDQYDSQAKIRGARSNNDGQLLFSLLSSF